jgi:ABC-2 type transport system permease protein
MKGYIAFTKKEVLESFRTYRILILVSVFFLFGMLSPLTAKLLPEIFKSLALDGIVITIPPPVALDAYAQLFKNLSQMGMLVVLLVFSGMLSTEITKGTLINMLTKGLSRSAVILSKFTVSLASWTLSLLLAFVTTYGYTVYLFGSGNQPNLLFSVFCLWLFGALLLSLILLSSSFMPGNFGGLTLTAILIVIMMILDAFPKLHQFNPIALASVNVALLAKTVNVSDVTPIVFITMILIGLSLSGSMLIFRKKRL